MAVARSHLLGLAFAAVAPQAMAQEGLPPEPVPVSTVSQQAVYFSAFLGGQTNPAYFGSDEYVFGPSFRAGVAQLSFLGFQYGAADFTQDPFRKGNGFAYGLAFRYIGKRDSDEYDEIKGLDDIDPTMEVGFSAGYVWPNWEAQAEARYGLGGSNAWVGELRLNYVMYPTDRLSLRVGPRVLFGTEHYVDTYFGISEEESLASGLDYHDPGAGLVSLGLEATAAYRIADAWWVEGGVKWQQFQGDAADSPIVRNGTDSYTEVRLGLRRTFVLRF